MNLGNIDFMELEKSQRVEGIPRLDGRTFKKIYQCKYQGSCLKSLDRHQGKGNSGVNVHAFTLRDSQLKFCIHELQDEHLQHNNLSSSLVRLELLKLKNGENENLLIF